jgi:hypothetical protein
MATTKAKTKAQAKTKTKGKGSSNPGGELRIRMYRVGFGDFFLVTVPSADGPQHILIDCGVTKGKTGKGDIATIKAAVRDMGEETDHKLALIIMTHRHQDHIIGFSRSEDEFLRFKDRVDAIWMPFWETEYDDKIKNLQAELAGTALALYQAALAGDKDPINDEIAGLALNASGTEEGPGGGTNAKSLALLKGKLGVKPKYYARGDTAALPEGLVKAGLGVEILGPPPADEFEFLKMMDLTKTVGQYLDATGGKSTKKVTLSPFGPEFKIGADAYPPSAFREWAPGGDVAAGKRHNDKLEAAVRNATPDALLMAAKKLDSLLNNQSLVVLFAWRDKRLLFAGDAQGGNWQSWLYDFDKPMKDPSKDPLSDKGRNILGSLAFYKVGHHGSTNATPIAAVEAMGQDFVAMCSTQANTFGNPKVGSEVPRSPLLEALERKSAVVRSDHYAATIDGKTVGPVDGSDEKLPKPALGRLVKGDCYVDYFL